YIVNSKGKFIEAVFENWTFPASLGTTISYTDLAGANQKRVPLRDDQSYSKTATDNLLAGRTFSTPATTTNRGVLKSSKNVADPIAVEKTDLASSSNAGVVTTTTNNSQVVSTDDSRMSPATTTQNGLL